MHDVAVIVPYFDRESHILDVIDSVLSQSLNSQLIIVDDKSPTALALPREYSYNPSITIVHHDENKGAGAARNTGLGFVDANWVSFLDSDDCLVPETLHLRVANAQKHLDSGTFDPALTFFGCSWLEHGDTTGPATVRTPKPGSKPEHFSSGCWWSPGSAMLCHHSVFAKNSHFNPLRFDETMRRSEDFDLGLRFGLAGGQLVVDTVCGVEIQPSPRLEMESILDAANYLLAKHARLKNEHPVCWRNMKAYLALEKAALYRRNNQKLMALRYALASFLLHPRTSPHLSPGWE